MEESNVYVSRFATPVEEEKSWKLHEQSLQYIEEAAKWAKFLAIVGFFILAMLLLVALITGFVLPQMNQGQEVMAYGTSFVSPHLLMLFYVLVAALYFFPILYLYRFASRSLSAIKEKDSNRLNTAFKSLKSHFKFIGILILINLAVYVALILGLLIAGIM